MGLFQSAERSSLAAVELFRSLRSAGPSVARYKSRLFQSLAICAQARVKLGRLVRADTAFREIRALLDQMGPETSLDQFEREKLGELEQARGTLLAEQGLWPDVVRVSDSNVQRREVLFFRQQHDNWTFLRGLIDSKSTLVEARLRAGRISRAEAIAALPEILIETEADSRRLDTPTLRATRGQVLLRQAALKAEAGAYAEAQSTLEAAVAPLEAMTTEHPKRHQWKLMLAQAVSLRSELHRRASRGPEALADARRAVEFLEPAIVEGSSYLFELGAFQTAYRDLADKLGTTQGKTAAPDLGTCLDTLNKAVSGGFDDAARLRQDPRLMVLRDRHKPEFDRLVAGASAAGKAALPAEIERSSR